MDNIFKVIHIMIARVDDIISSILQYRMLLPSICSLIDADIYFLAGLNVYKPCADSKYGTCCIFDARCELASAIGPRAFLDPHKTSGICFSLTHQSLVRVITM